MAPWATALDRSAKASLTATQGVPVQLPGGDYSSLSMGGSGRTAKDLEYRNGRAHSFPECKVTPVGFEHTPLRNGALSHRLRPLGQSVSGCIILERIRKVGCSHHAQHTGILRVVRAQLCNRQGLPKFPCPLVLSLFRSVASVSQRLCDDDGGRPNWSSGAACALEAEA